MALKTDIRGMVHHYPDYFVVGREKIREYAKAVQSSDGASHDEEAAAEQGHPALMAPLTFTAVYALLVQQDFFRTVDVGIETMNIVQVDQRFVYHRPIYAGDRLWARLEIHSVDERFGADIVVTRNVCTDDDGVVVLEAFTTLMGQQAEQTVKITGM
ncbi:(3R)-hydroxyacyl-ACP dehydratase subunit HadC [Mycolicibacterium sp. P1-18]|uniref:(3R)-hydroxyacyl-ACP dehydratase subunit HadC n=1 Tax=Mycolicibacterium sp. P1-18 TaxID=2024615 RepID=UPI0011F183DB|nr:(3R)-hydroxyacyl-ACP dehydratase subunit HadC [Mycolicibacterium sp. P1-18]KAA0098172.1 (3R)-hydroxyacyl-ACP dehydratase subunit HadC [Mycolicibacterium sp. P1-18]